MKYVVTINDKKYEVEVEKGQATLVEPAQAGAAAAPATPPGTAAPAAPAGKKLLAPMPGVVINTRVEAGARVKSGQPLLVLEAMKMENDITAPAAGTVNAVAVHKGDMVSTGDLLVVIG